jgi:hypothetical protein
MRYVILMYADPERTKAMTPDELAEVGRKHEALRSELLPSGELVGGDGLVLPEETTTLRWNGPTTTGPLHAATEHLTAYYVVECDSDDRVLQIAARVLDFHVIAVEVRRSHDRVRTPEP